MNKPEKKSILSECSYQGGGIQKKYITERSNFIDGYNKAIDDVNAWLPNEGEIEKIMWETARIEIGSPASILIAKASTPIERLK